jgi:phage tail sheath protein FI
MPVQTSYPGVYVQEVPSGVRTIAGVSTSVAVFIGQAAWGPVNEPVLCLNYTEFQRTFTSDVTQGDLARAVKLFFLNGGTQSYIMRVAKTPGTATTTLVDDSGGGATATLIITSKYAGALGSTLRVNIKHPAAGLFDLKIYRVVVNSAGVEVETDAQTWTGLSMSPIHPRFAINYVKSDWVTLSQPVVANLLRPLLSPVGPPAAPFLLAGGTDGAALTAAEYDAAYIVLDQKVDLYNLMVLPKNTAGVVQTALWNAASIKCKERRAFLLMDPKETWTTAQLAIDPLTGINSLRSGLVKDCSAVFFPRLTLNENGTNVQIGASGAVAGLMARTDASRGVWKAPAGTEADFRGISGLENRFSDGENGVLNPRGVNTIRIFPNGIVNWGARTMDGDDDFASEYKYIPIRRTALFIEESLYRGLKWVVFEPNDEPLWAQIRLNVGAFMHNLFRQGAFQGTKKQDAYFVKCDSETTTQNDINLGIVNIWVGFAPLKPAEFVVLYLQQMTGQIQV